jgi:Leucine-rich repeat (LRR) protein
MRSWRAMEFFSGGSPSSGVGTFPDAVCSWPLLKSVGFNTPLSGAIPPCFGTVAANPQLMLVYVTHTQLSNFPVSVFSNPSVTQIAVYSNPSMAAALPPLTAAQCALTSIDISNNNLTGIVPDFRPCSNLVFVNAAGNALTSLATPAAFDGLRSLVSLSLVNNSIGGSLPTLQGCSSLISLGLSNNQFTGDAPASWASLPTALTTLDLSNNRLNGTMRAVQQMTGLQTVSFRANRLTLPANPAALYPIQSDFVTEMLPAGVMSADFSSNNITIDLLDTASFALQTKVQHLLLAQNRIGCYSPTLLSRLSTMLELDLSDNALGTTTNCPFFTYSSSSQIQILRLQNNPAYVSTLAGGTLPSWLAFDASQWVKYDLTQRFSCPQIVSSQLAHQVKIRLDPGYFRYTGCICDKGNTAVHAHGAPRAAAAPAPAPAAAAATGERTRTRRATSLIRQFVCICLPGARLQVCTVRRPPARACRSQPVWRQHVCRVQQRERRLHWHRYRASARIRRELQFRRGRRC